MLQESSRWAGSVGHSGSFWKVPFRCNAVKQTHSAVTKSSSRTVFVKLSVFSSIGTKAPKVSWDFWIEQDLSYFFCFCLCPRWLNEQFSVFTLATLPWQHWLNTFQTDVYQLWWDGIIKHRVNYESFGNCLTFHLVRSSDRILHVCVVPVF